MDIEISLNNGQEKFRIISEDSELDYTIKRNDKGNIEIIKNNRTIMNVSRSETNNSELIENAINNNLERVLELLKNGVDVNYKNNSGTTAIMEAAWNGNLEMVKALIEAGALYCEKNSGGNTPLDLAILTKRTDLIEYFKNLNLVNQKI